MTKPTDWRALCAELVSIIEHHAPAHIYDLPYESAAMRRARTALSQAEPEGVSPDHVNLIAFAYSKEPWATWLKPGGCLESAHCEMSELLLAAITRYGRPTIQPVSVAERLPVPEDCDAEGRCWLFHVGIDCIGDWHQRAPYPKAISYQFFRITHWLPHHALPTPTP
jgi:hypothetical protein